LEKRFMKNRLKRFLKSLIPGAQPRTWPEFDDNDLNLLSESLFTIDWSGEPETSQFTSDFCKFLDAKHGVSVNSGTSALEVAVQSLGIKRGDEVLVPAYTFYSTASAIMKAEATPVFIDVQLKDACINPSLIEQAITPKTKALIVVHLAGHPVDFEPILQICNKWHLPVIEDAAHAIGSEWKNNRVGTIGSLGCFSFQSSKTLTAGEGGFISTNDADLYALCHSLTNLGRPYGGSPSEHYLLGGNYRLSKVQAALLSIQLTKFERQWQRRDSAAKQLRSELSTISGLSPLQIASYASRVDCSYFPFVYEASAFGGIDKPTLISALNAEGVPAFGAYSCPLPEQPIFQGLNITGSFPVAKELCDRLIVIPHTTLLQPTDKISDISTRIEKVQRRFGNQRQ
jgi:dTDP-4-amino-4,6-dideoxygalactose transaminase